MKAKVLLPIAMILSASAHAGPAADSAGQAPQRVYTYSMELGPDGSVSRIAPHGFAADATSRKLDGEIRNWIFEPAGVSGGTASTRTYLRIVIASDSTDASGFQVVSATTGPAPLTLDQPEYPVRDQMQGNEGTVVLELQVGADGLVADAKVHDVSGRASRAMAASALAAARDWTFTPELVDGKPVKGTMLWPVCYLGQNSSVADCRWNGPDAQRLSSKTVLTLDPTVRLISPIALQQP